MSKSPDAFRTISEVAEDLDLPQHVLRFWETRFTQIKPMKRGGGRRYYRPDDIDLLRGIRHLLYGEGYTIRGVQRILKEQGPRFVIGAGRGELSVEQPPEAEKTAPAKSGKRAAKPRVEPTFAAAARTRSADPEPEEEDKPAPATGGLSAADIRQLEKTLAELLDCKRLLDQVK